MLVEIYVVVCSYCDWFGELVDIDEWGLVYDEVELSEDVYCVVVGVCDYIGEMVVVDVVCLNGELELVVGCYGFWYGL